MNEKLHIQIHYYTALLIAFCLPIARLTPIFIALMLLNWLVEGDFKNKFHLILKNKFALLFSSFYFIHFIGLLYTGNMDAGLFDVQVKFSLLVFPILFASRPLKRTQVNALFVSLIAGGVASSLIMICRAVYTYFIFDENNFFYQAFSFLIHPSYLSLYFNVCIGWLLLNLVNKNKFLLSKSFSIGLILFFTAVIILLSSKMGLITMLLLYIGFAVWFIASRKKYLAGIAGLMLIIVFIFSMFRFVPEIHDRVVNALSALSSAKTDQAEGESTAVRLLVWKASNQVIAENFITGTGTGDSKDALLNEYQKRGMTGALEHKLNTHNEFYQVFVSLGLIGFILLIANLFIPLAFSIKNQDTIYTLFLVVMILNFIPESMLETQAGVMFYAFINAAVCFSEKDNLIDKAES
jgi:O-antigen ligase